MPTEPTSPEATAGYVAELETTVDEAIAACDGDAHGAVRALIVTMSVFEAEVAALQQEAASLRAVILPGYVRGRVGPKKDSGRGEP